VVTVLKKQLDNIAESQKITILNKECNLDHILFRGTPMTNLSKIVNAFKGATSRELRSDFSKIKKHESLWSPTYFLTTTDEVTLNQLNGYVENQRDEID